MSDYIKNSILFKGSLNQKSILAAMSSPINQPLIQQVDEYMDDEVEVEDNGVSIDTENSAPSGGGGGGGGASFTPSGSFSGDFSDDFDGDFEDSGDMGEMGDDIEPSEDIEIEDTDEGDVDSATKITAGTYVTIDSVSNAVNEIPGTLNLRDDTAGVTHATLKGGTDNEVWVYYDTNVNINSILDQVIKTLSSCGMYFLEFNRVARNENAIVFSISWVSSYFDTTQLIKSDNE